MALEQFTRASAHDLQSPLRNIETLVMMMGEDCADSLNGEAKDYLRQIENRVEKLRELLKDMLEFSRLSLSEVTLRDSDLNDALSRALDHIQQDADAVGAKILTKNLPHAKINSGLVVQLFMNLIGNSIKYRSESPRIQIDARTEGPMVVVSVRDNGIGIDREFADRIFEPLQRLHTHR